MSVSLPKPVAAYFSADLSNGETVAQCFTEDAVVKDEGLTYIGVAAINEWKTSSSKKIHLYCSAVHIKEQRWQNNSDGHS